MKLKCQLPSNRTFEQLLNHYLVEKSIAERLKSSSRQDRKQIFATMYDELFSKVPDHPRLTQRNSEEETAINNKVKKAIIKRFITESNMYLEFAPGDCRFAYLIAENVKTVFGIDISDQRNPSDRNPENFKLIIYDGYNLPEIEPNSIDIVFSYQLIEHLHPEDTILHFELVRKILKDGGKYVFQTPHAFSGPYDISMFFSDIPEGFHLKEWTFIEINSLLEKIGYSSFQTRWSARGIDIRLPYLYFSGCEHILSLLPRRYIRKAAKSLMPMLYGVAIR